MRNSIKNILPVLGTLAAFALAPAANAAIIITSGVSNVGTDNVLFNDPTTVKSGSLVQGNFSGTGAGYFVNFTSGSGNNQIAGSGGQATINGLTGNNPFTNLRFALSEPGATFTKAVLNPDALADGSITFTVAYIGGSFTSTVPLVGNGNNFYTIEGNAGERITSITFSTTVGLQDASQFRLGGFARATVPGVPDGGSTVVLLGLALAALGFAKRRLLS